MSVSEALRPSQKETRRDQLVRYARRASRRIDRYIAANSLVPTDPVLDPAAFAGLRDLEVHWRDVRAELDRVLRYREDIPAFQDVSPDQYRISKGDNWKTLFLFGFGYRSEVNSRLCPKTAALLQAVPGIQTAFFSILAPGTHIPRHKGVSKRLINCHLGVIVPKDRERCYLECGGVRCLWEEGKVIAFDDTYPHEVHNNTPEERVVLMLQIERPLKPRAKLVLNTVMWLLKRSKYVTDARRNQRRWERRLGERIAAVEEGGAAGR